MSFLSVSSKRTRVHLSPDQLGTITSENVHKQSDDFQTDVAVMPMNKSYIQLFKSSKESLLNICKIKKENDKESINVLVKFKMEYLEAVAAWKKGGSGQSYAVGYSTGQVRIRDLPTSKLIKDFASPPNGSSVFFLDFSSSNEHLAAVHEDGMVNIFGMQTSVKLHSFPLDNQSTLARFHPNKKSLLGVASYSGKVSVLDIYAKKSVFKVDEHSAPCSDIAMFDDFLLSSGYDSLVKIYDLRKKAPLAQIQSLYGWTTIAISNCGRYFVGGNMKGELISYDMRYTKKTLASARIENSSHKISRVAFLSTDGESNNTVDIAKEVRQSLCKIEEEVDEKQFNETEDDFIKDLLGFQKGRISDFSSNTANYGTRVSFAARRSSTGIVDFPSKNINDFASPAQSPASLNLDDSCVNKSRRNRSVKDSKLRASMGIVLHEINEEQNDKENDVQCANIVTTPTTVMPSPRYSSTPAIVLSESKDSPTICGESKEVVEIDGDESFQSVQNTEIPKEPNQCSCNFDFRKEFDALSEKIHIEVGSMNMDQNMRYIEMMTHVGEQRRQLQSRIKMIEESLAILLNDDFKINMINELQAENQHLRQQVQELTRRLSQ